MPTPTKSQNPTIVGSGDPDSAQLSHPSRFCHWHPSFGNNGYPPFKKTTQNQNLFLLPNEGRQWRNLQGCDNWVLSGSPEPTMVGFCDLVGVGIGSVSKKRKKTSAREFGLFIKKIDFYLGLIYSKCQAICPVLTCVSSSSFGQK